MAIIAKIGQILNTPISMPERSSEKRSVKHSSNPFAATSFKGNVLTADVFETKASSKNKLTYSAFVGSINDAFPTYRKAVESVIAFGNRMKEGVSSVAHKINEIGSMEVPSIDFAGAGRAIKSGFTSMMDSYSVQKLKKCDVNALDEMWASLSEAKRLDVAV